MSWLLAHQLQFAFSFFENDAGSDVVRRIDHEIFVDVWCFTVGKNHFNRIAAIFDLGHLYICFRFRILANAVQYHIKGLTVVVENTEVALCVERRKYNKQTKK